MTAFSINDKSTIKIKLLGKIPKRLFILDSKGRIYYFRDMAAGQREIETNIIQSGKYFINAPAQVFKYPLKKYVLNYDLPPKEKDFFHPHFRIVYNPHLVGTPARNFYKEGLIEVGDKFRSLPFQIRLFILCHEIGHSFYHDEQKADLFACKLFLSKGYSKTMALHSLTDVLSNNQRNKERIINILKALKK